MVRRLNPTLPHPATHLIRIETISQRNAGDRCASLATGRDHGLLEFLGMSAPAPRALADFHSVHHRCLVDTIFTAWKINSQVTLPSAYTQRPHSALDKRTPDEFYFASMLAIEQAA